MIAEVIVAVVVASGAFVFLEKKAINKHKKNINYQPKRDSSDDDEEDDDNEN